MPERGNGSASDTRGPALSNSGRVWVHAEACVSVQRSGTQCRECAKACPAQAIQIDERSLEISMQSCVGCGRCQTACPTEAITVGGFEISDSASRRLECSRVPLGALEATARVVPCLGGLSAGVLRALLTAPGDHITIVDRGWCERCVIGGMAAPWADAVARVERELRSLESGTRRIMVERSILDAGSAGPAPAPQARSFEAPLSRRQLFARAAHPAPRPPSHVRAARIDAAPARVAIAALEQRIAWLRHVADSNDLPAGLLPGAKIADTCCDNQVCVSACPTGALRTITDTGRTSVAFDASLCIACGACERACPTGSMSISPEGAGPYSGPVVLREQRFVTCSRCEADFISKSDDEQVCLACRKDTDVARLGHGLFRPRTKARDDETVA